MSATQIPSASSPRAGDKRALARTLRQSREAAGLSIRRLAERVGLNHAYLADLEKGRKSSPSAEVLVRIATALELDVDELLRLGGHSYMVDLPDFGVYLRTKYDVSDETLHHMRTQWKFARQTFDQIDDLSTGTDRTA